MMIPRRRDDQQRSGPRPGDPLGHSEADSGTQTVNPRRYLHPYHEVIKLLAHFESVERTIPAVLSLMSEIIPLHVAVMILEERAASPRPSVRAIVWHVEDASASRLRSAKTHAKAAYAYLAPMVTNFEEETRGPPFLPPGSSAPEPSRARFILLPLVVAHNAIFGALHLEGPAELEEADLAFVNVIVNQLAIAINRITVVAAEQAAAKARQAAAERAVQARQNLIANVSHDLRNPVGTILLTTSFLLDNATVEQSPTLKQAIQLIQRSGDRLLRLSAELGDVASIDAGRLSVAKDRHAGVRIVAEAIERHAAAAAQKKIRLDSTIPSETFEVVCDRDRVLQVLGHLIGNAIKFTPEDGAIHVRAEPRGGETLFSVADTGPGIAAEALAHVFDRCWQATDTARLGTGLGLFISKSIVEAHGGRTWVVSTEGAGARFYFALPFDSGTITDINVA